MHDFTFDVYRKLLILLDKAGYSFQTLSDFLEKPGKKVVILRHDIDAKKYNALKIAHIEHTLGIRGSYYFRIKPRVLDLEIIADIKNMGHEIGYHYEDMALAKGNPEKATELFKAHLELLRNVYPVTTICMHGSPLKKIDNRTLWKHIDYRNYGITGEPYYDINYCEVLYLTDTGRCWNRKYSIRDNVDNLGLNGKFNFHTSFDLLKNVFSLPEKILLTTHPQRWNDNLFDWYKELIFQTLKNKVKRIVKRSKYYLIESDA